MRIRLLIFFAFYMLHLSALAAAAHRQERTTPPQASALPYGQLIKFRLNLAKGFHWAYFLYLPKSLS